MTVSEWPTDTQTATNLEQSSERRMAQYLVFVVAGLEMGVSLERVSEIVPYERVSIVPGTPAYVRGVVHVRGRVIPVIDLAIKLQRSPQPATKRTCILMLELDHDGRRIPFGLVMDGVATLLDVDRSEVQAAPRFGTTAEVRFLEGLLPREAGMLPLLDVERAFADQELSQALVALSDEDRP
ncbi:MAG: chemotaxis protein CheW [Myxococcaceae bacterium]|nr:chemotaxis protein CheW [Myxococcaceae bacterium]